ncbi:5-formyltetrahydrofolate cyclo-ligase [Anaeromyxobacter diazotrophicus]|uniref:5-formyltetrahydrofolate cyclo-ligase n=1 Tax=Anaeromyxobacter diazotrophicus TaxID=2590199 RepID=A0A7I9VQS4_9BACT|nr:5-formyltetrahydrofolate cyclo-ligase [Anaeromyxobacter diazotrophicus]GEJ58764.1 5-formyltetrahydrofolate cyclo-ligase [Anaeromyxobacter diazotrophicus]
MSTTTLKPKGLLREELVAARLRLAPETRAARSARIAARVLALDAFERAGTVALYAALGAEVDPAGVAAEAAARGKRLAYPRFILGEHALRFARCEPGALVPGPHRTLEPPPGAELLDPGALDLVLVPGVGFDAAGRRLGRGRGHYDATLAALGPAAVKLGLAFEVQLVAAVPEEAHDVALDGVVTEARVLWRPR